MANNTQTILYPVRRDVSRGGFYGCLIAAVVTTIVYLIGMAGAPIRVVTGWAPDGADLTITEVLITAAVAVVLGAVLLGWWQRRNEHAWSRWVLTAGIVAVMSAVPLWRLNVDTASKVSLTALHLATGVAAVTGQQLARHRAVDR